MIKRDLPASVLSRRAIVYVRQSTSLQVTVNLESQRQQYELADLARVYGFKDVTIIDADLGISASGTSERPGFRSLVGQICEGVVGAVFCLDASRLARNGRDWHHLLELCALVDARVIDADGVYHPGLPNDRLLLGLKGTMSEFELTTLRRRLLEAARAKARRGELRLPVPVGYVWPQDTGLTMDPDRRVQRRNSKRLSVVRAARKRTTGDDADAQRRLTVSAARRCQAANSSRVALALLSQRHQRPPKSFLCWSVRLRKIASADEDRRWRSTQDVRASVPARRVDGTGAGSSRGVCLLGGLRA
jgi:DNA invertase Pin-like site-specific DNA recombinase